MSNIEDASHGTLALMLLHLLTFYWIKSLNFSPIDYVFSIFLTCMSKFHIN